MIRYGDVGYWQMDMADFDFYYHGLSDLEKSETGFSPGGNICFYLEIVYCGDNRGFDSSGRGMGDGAGWTNCLRMVGKKNGLGCLGPG